MKKTVGLWIDHKKAVMVFLAGNNAETKLLTSNIELQQRQSVVTTPRNDIRARKSKSEPRDFYDDVISCIRGAEEILILGPGEAKGELRKRLEKNYLGQRIVGVETSGRMTDLQTIAKVRKHFLSLAELKP
jgi:stalled ribosome rescue protein Dom34